MEQRVDSSVTPLMSEDGTASTYSPMTIPPVDKKNNIGEGEPVQYHDPRSDMMMTGRMVIVDRVPYFKEDGMPVTLRAEVTQ